MDDGSAKGYIKSQRSYFSNIGPDQMVISLKVCWLHSKFDEKYCHFFIDHYSDRNDILIAMIFCTYQDSTAVLVWAKCHCDQTGMEVCNCNLWFEIALNSASRMGTWLEMTVLNVHSLKLIYAILQYSRIKEASLRYPWQQRWDISRKNSAVPS